MYHLRLFKSKYKNRKYVTNDLIQTEPTITWNHPLKSWPWLSLWPKVNFTLQHCYFNLHSDNIVGSSNNGRATGETYLRVTRLEHYQNTVTCAYKRPYSLFVSCLARSSGYTAARVKLAPGKSRELFLPSKTGIFRYRRKSSCYGTTSKTRDC